MALPAPQPCRALPDGRGSLAPFRPVQLPSETRRALAWTHREPVGAIQEPRIDQWVWVGGLTSSPMRLGARIGIILSPSLGSFLVLVLSPPG